MVLITYKKSHSYLKLYTSFKHPVEEQWLFFVNGVNNGVKR